MTNKTEIKLQELSARATMTKKLVQAIKNGLSLADVKRLLKLQATTHKHI